TIALDAGRMRFSYDNRGTIACPWSEAKADYNGIGVDWTAGGLFDFTVLSIGIDGNMYNAVDPEYDRMYVAIEDTAGNFNLVNHPDPNVQRKTCCQEWQIPLADLNDPNVDLTDINALYIGTGPRCSWGPPPYTYGGEGVIYIDNIRLYMKVCQQGYRPAGDLTRDCVVDLYDLKVLCEEWLTEGTVSDIYPKGSRDCFVDFRDFAILADEWIMENY
ncbi:MAG: hypothetical protein JW749_07725, partial [Sedimentisphaerales bacterium]|nr:hypothetical protein [Sedimentisphaerales bacterium]